MTGTFDLFQQSQKNSGKHKKYFEVYDKIFERFRNKKITFVEVGVLNGGSLEIWKKYFHEDSRIIGIDLNPECKKFEKKGVEIFIGNQSSETFWDDFYKKVGKIDILLEVLPCVIACNLIDCVSSQSYNHFLDFYFTNFYQIYEYIIIKKSPSLL